MLPPLPCCGWVHNTSFGKRDLLTENSQLNINIPLLESSHVRTMDAEQYPDCIKDLPKAKIPMEGVQAWIAQGATHQVAFFEIEPIGIVPPHSHTAQYGFVI